MLSFVSGAFVVLHGLVHLLYAGQSWRLFELQPGLLWPEGSWAFSRLLGDKRTRLLATISCLLAAIAFVVGGTGIVLRKTGWRPMVVGAAVFSTAVYALFWDGKRQKLDAKGGIGILINMAILFSVLILRWPDF